MLKTLPRLCVSLGFGSVKELEEVAEHEYRGGATFFEFRLDYLPDPAAAFDLIRNFLRVHSDARILATCRHEHARGEFSGTVNEQLAILRSSAQAGAELVDLEIESAEQIRSAAAALRESALLVISYHNFESTPSLDRVMQRLRKVQADVYKIATTARKQTDNLRVIDFLRRGEHPSLVALAMSEVGIATRVLSAGSVFTFAAPDGTAGTASGQIPARIMHSLYRPEKLTKQTRVYGVVAHPVSHSKSPFIHNRSFQACGIDSVYLPFLVSPGQLGNWMNFAEKLPVAGFSVTIPHKRKIMRYLDIIEPLAKRIGAVNTVWRAAGKWRGTNTDTEGVIKPLRRHLPLANASVLIAGYGGAARAAAIALKDAGAKVTITGRKIADAASLARVIKGDAVTLEEARRGKSDVLVHATPVGMAPDVTGNLFADGVPAQVVLDMVYNPHETALLKLAKEQGCTVIPGVEMLLEQAACQFEIWTGEPAPRDVMREALQLHI